MGFTVRDIRWRYTVWLKFDGVRNEAIWPSKDADIERKESLLLGEELYDHAGDTGVNFDKYENVNVNTQYPDICKKLFNVFTRNTF